MLCAVRLLKADMAGCYSHSTAEPQGLPSISLEGSSQKSHSAISVALGPEQLCDLSKVQPDSAHAGRSMWMFASITLDWARRSLFHVTLFYLSEKIQVGHSAEHGEQEDGKEIDDPKFGRVDLIVDEALGVPLLVQHNGPGIWSMHLLLPSLHSNTAFGI